MRMDMLVLAAMANLALAFSENPAIAEDDATAAFWNGVWFECEFAGRTTPPEDGCAMLDDDGFLFGAGRVTYIKVKGSKETDGCRKRRAGQCFRADEARIEVEASRSGRAEFSPDTLGIRFLGCTQVFHAAEMGDFLEARPDGKRCIWAGEKRFYLRRYGGKVIGLE